ncbi:hypothetical protein BT96DRAFT_366037 [Gymnopus androsaceus JB14]|uniref:Uncharacterized protein n=1 Tax=Gymnopus androsaceus JB14 TaxID=1447944 RepID=A0A6A4GWP5_9AGAR|nr:hypothetical protein BT96DRAFT_366037 [Gymnopus androsaceus JB14]
MTTLFELYRSALLQPPSWCLSFRTDRHYKQLSSLPRSSLYLRPSHQYLNKGTGISSKAVGWRHAVDWKWKSNSGCISRFVYCELDVGCPLESNEDGRTTEVIQS